MMSKPLIAGLASIAAMAAVLWSMPAVAAVPSWVPPMPASHPAHHAHDRAPEQLEQAPYSHPDDANASDANAPDADAPDANTPDRDSGDAGAPEPARPLVVLHDDEGTLLRERMNEQEHSISVMEMLGPFALLVLLLGALALGAGRGRR